MHTFLRLWFGQFVSAIGSSMTYFALTIWVWQRTGSTTAIALILFFYQLPQIAMVPLSGVLVDRIPRKRLLILSDSGAAGCTMAAGILAALHSLQIWQIYLLAAIMGCFSNVQTLTATTLIPLLLPPRHHTRASSLAAMVGDGASILAPALAGGLYPVVGLLGMTTIDLVTFAIAILTLRPIPLSHQHPQAVSPDADPQPSQPQRGFIYHLWSDLKMGCQYIAAHPHLLALLIVLSTFACLQQMSETLYQPLVLARTEGDSRLLGVVVATSGLGGVVGGVMVGFWGGFRHPVRGMLLGFIGTGVSGLGFGLSHTLPLWIVTQFWEAFHLPLILSSYMTVWYAQVPLSLQGRVFAVDQWVGLVIGAIASLMAGFIVDRIVEPFLQQSARADLVRSLLGIDSGSGIALLYIGLSISMIGVGVAGFFLPRLRATIAIAAKSIDE